MKLAVFTDACCKPKQGKTGLAAIGYDVTDPTRPFELFAKATCIPYCDSTEAEHRALLLGIREVLPAALHGGGQVESLTLFTDAEAIANHLARMAAGKSIRSPVTAGIACDIRDNLVLIRGKGCFVAIEVIPRKLNRRADKLSRAAIKGETIAALAEPMPLHVRYPFLTILNS